MDWLWIILLIVLALVVAWWLLSGSRRRSSTMDASSRSAYDRGASPLDSTTSGAVAGEAVAGGAVAGSAAGAVDAGMPDGDDLAMGDSTTDTPSATDRHDFTTSETASTTTAQTGDIADSDLDATGYEVDDMAMPGDDMATAPSTTGVDGPGGGAAGMDAGTADESMAGDAATAGGAMGDTPWDETDVEGDYVADVVDYQSETPPGGAEDVTAEPAATVDEMAAGVSRDPVDDPAAMAPSDMGESAGGDDLAADREAMDHAATGVAGAGYDTAPGSDTMAASGDDMAARGVGQAASGTADGPYGAGSAAPAADGTGPAGYDIKGNADSMLYHTTDSPSYGTTKAEVWFASEEAARNAGFTRWNER